MLNCIIVDDEPLALKQLEGYIEKVPFLSLKKSYLSATDALEYLAEGEVDLIFLDINMPDLNGLDFIKSLSNSPMVIFTTAYSEYALDGFKVDAIDYLLKPLTFEDIVKASKKALRFKRINFKEDVDTDDTPYVEDGYIFVKSDYKIVCIQLDKILYIESMSEYVRIYLEDEKKPVITLLTMSRLDSFLSSYSFMRIHRSYIVNLHKILEISRMRINFGKDQNIPIGEIYKDKFFKFIEKNYIGKL